MPSQLLNRYLAGERDSVWAEIVNYEADNPDQEFYEVACEVADVFVARCKRNLERISVTLQELGYVFERSAGPYALANARSLKALNACEKEWGSFPVLVRKWYEVFEFVDFAQDENQLMENGPLRGLGLYPQLRFLSMKECREMRKENDQARRDNNVFMTRVMAERGKCYIPHEEESLLILGACASNCDMKAFTLPSKRIDDVFYNDGDGPKYFHEDLEFIMRCGGFPQLLQYVNHQGLRESLGMNHPQLLLDKLIRGFEPV